MEGHGRTYLFTTNGLEQSTEHYMSLYPVNTPIVTKLIGAGKKQNRQVYVKCTLDENTTDMILAKHNYRFQPFAAI